MNGGIPVLKKKIRVRGHLITLTGLHVGGSDVGLKVGGADKVVVKDPKTGRPYIPGSTIKGKMRCLLEKAGFCCPDDLTLARQYHYRHAGKPQWASCSCGTCVVCQLFGVAAEVASDRRSHGAPTNAGQAGTDASNAEKANTGTSNGETANKDTSTPIRCVGRLIFRDARLSEESARDMENWRYLSAPYLEVKTEVSIDRLTSAANPRNFERVPAGARFDFEVVLDVMSGDNETEYLRILFQGFQLLANDYLGGQGTRGYGAVQIAVNTIEELDIANGTFAPTTVAGIQLPWQAP